MDQNQDLRSGTKAESADPDRLDPESRSESESCCLGSCWRWCCTHCFVQKPEGQAANPGPRRGPGHAHKKQGSTNQKTEEPVRKQVQKTRHSPSQVGPGDPQTQVAPTTPTDSGSSAATKTSKKKATPTTPTSPTSPTFPKIPTSPAASASSAVPKTSKKKATPTSPTTPTTPTTPTIPTTPTSPTIPAAPTIPTTPTTPTSPTSPTSPTTSPTTPASSAAPKTSKKKATAKSPTTPAAPASAESQLQRIRTEFVNRVSEAILKQLLDALESDGVFSMLEIEAIVQKNRARADKARDLIDPVAKKGEEASKRMIKHLQTKDPMLSFQLGLLSAAPGQEGTQLMQNHNKEEPGSGQPGPTTTTSSEEEIFRKEFLETHNAYREKHYAPPLAYNDELNAAAQKRASKMLETNSFEVSDTDDGQNAYSVSHSKALRPKGKEVVDFWYKKDYDFNNPGFHSETASFAQLVWRDTRELGLGFATDGKTTYVVGHYRPAGNIDTEERFRKNVLPKGSSSKLLTADATFQREFLDTHNALRALHHAPPLTLNMEMSVAAQSWADQMLETNLQGPSDCDDGELTSYMMRYKHFKPTGKEAVELWYDDIKNYDFSKPGFHKQPGSFAQVVWRDTRELGVGMASDGVRTFVVGHYRPNGNVIFEDSFQKNVLPKGEEK